MAVSSLNRRVGGRPRPGGGRAAAGDEPASDLPQNGERVVLRPVRRRTRRFVAVALGGVCAWVAIAVVAAGGRSGTDSGLDARFWSGVLVAAGLWGLPAALWAAYLALGNRNQRIVVGDGIELVDWRGRRRVAARDDVRSAVRYHMVFRNSEGRDRYDSLVVVGFDPGQPPLLLWGSRWDQRTIERLCAALGLALVDANDWKAPVTVAEVGADNPDLAMPWPWRRPWAIAMAVFAGAMAYVVVAVVVFVLVVP